MENEAVVVAVGDELKKQADSTAGGVVRDREYYRAIGRMGGEKVKAERGQSFYEAIGRKGGERLRDTRGPGFYEAIGHKGGQKTKALVEAGKKALQQKRGEEGE